MSTAFAKLGAMAVKWQNRPQPNLIGLLAKGSLECRRSWWAVWAKDLKQQLMEKSVSQTLRVLKVKKMRKRMEKKGEGLSQSEKELKKLLGTNNGRNELDSEQKDDNDDDYDGATSIIVGTIIAIHEEEGLLYIGCKGCKQKVIRSSDMVDLEADVPDEVTWKTFEGNTCDLGSILKETGQEYDFTPKEVLKNKSQIVEMASGKLVTPSGSASDRVRKTAIKFLAPLPGISVKIPSFCVC
ncbi:hypothetical protein Tco_1274743 [Tanacetum coccineum]